jgi:tRNA A-37 threonylcarbamoyl transferase component Bud32
MTLPDDSWQKLLPPMLGEAGLPAEGFSVQPLKGGVSSDIVRVRLADGRMFCAKRALRQLQVESEWQVPVERNHFEVAWLRRAGAVVRGAAPEVIGEDRVHGVALLEYLPPGDYALWKDELLAGRADGKVPLAVADTIGRIHAATLGDGDVAAEFATDALFDALRLDPYLRTLMRRYPQLAGPIGERIAVTAATKIALVHGDLSPKNILISRADGHPVILDAECAWYGDPAFDAAFCVNHLVLKAIHMPRLAGVLLAEAGAFVGAWLGHFPADMRGALAERTAALLPCLMLARVDGKSPVEYLRAEEQQSVRAITTALIGKPPGSVDAVFDATREGIGLP